MPSLSDALVARYRRSTSNLWQINFGYIEILKIFVI